MDGSIFDYLAKKEKEDKSPLAYRMRPKTLDEVVGQEHICGEGKLLRRAIDADRISSVIFYGPPGTGKTSLSEVIANQTKSYFTRINATTAGKKDMEERVGAAKEALSMYGKRTILFIDEIHRFNKSQQDYLLPFVEDGTVILIGATTENPFFEVNQALLSRSLILELYKLSRDDIKRLMLRAIEDTERGLGAFDMEVEDEALDFLADYANGDARAALNALELAAVTTGKSGDGKIHVDIDTASECIQKRVISYDKNADAHYDVISAFIKSMRGSDPDAAVYYLARMIAAGEDIKFIARRIMICAAEDVGLADPKALLVASAADRVVERVGLPEARIPLAEAAIYVALAPKSNSAYMAVDKALSEVAQNTTPQVPMHLRDAHYKGAAKLGRGLDYKYAHDFEEHYVRQQYLPEEIKDTVFYDPGDLGEELGMKERLKRLRSRKS